MCNQNATQAAINQTAIINMAEGIFSSADNKINMTFSIVAGPTNFTTCTSTDAAGLLTQFQSAIWSLGPRDLAQLFTGDTMDNGFTGATWAGIYINNSMKSNSYTQYVGFTDAERARNSVHEMAPNFNATDTNLTHPHIGEGVKWSEQAQIYVSLMHSIDTTAGWLPTNYFSDGTKRMFQWVSDSQRNNTKWLLIAASRDLYRYS